MQRFLVENEKGPDLEFEGEQLVNEAQPGLGTVEVWRTARGRYVAKRRRYAHRGRPYVYSVDVFDSLEPLAEWLGDSAEAKRICASLGHRKVRKID
jgi:hypothetical protein